MSSFPFVVGKRYRNKHDPARTYLACNVPWPQGGSAYRIILFVVEGTDVGWCFNMGREDLFPDFEEVCLKPKAPAPSVGPPDHVYSETLYDRDDNPIEPTCAYCGNLRRYCRAYVGTRSVPR
jgi:hypothetical protein